MALRSRGHSSKREMCLPLKPANLNPHKLCLTYTTPLPTPTNIQMKKQAQGEKSWD